MGEVIPFPHIEHANCRCWVTFEQEPLSAFRRDLAAEDEMALRAEREAKRIVWRGMIEVAWLARRLTRG